MHSGKCDKKEEENIYKFSKIEGKKRRNFHEWQIVFIAVCCCFYLPSL